MSIGRCAWLLQEGQWLCGFLLTFSFLSSCHLTSCHLCICSCPLTCIPYHQSLWLSAINLIFQPLFFLYCLFIAFNLVPTLTLCVCVCPHVYKQVWLRLSNSLFLFLVLLPVSAVPYSCFSERWINATEVARAPSLFTAGKKTKQKQTKTDQIWWVIFLSNHTGKQKKQWKCSMSVPPTVMAQEGLAHTYSLTWCWIAWLRVSLSLSLPLFLFPHTQIKWMLWIATTHNRILSTAEGAADTFFHLFIF